MILLDGNRFEQGTTVTIQDLNGKQGTGHWQWRSEQK